MNPAAPEPSPVATSGVTSSKHGSTRALVALLAFVLGFATVPHRVMEREANDWLHDHPARTDALAGGIARWTASAGVLDPGSFATGSSRFDGRGLFATHTMAAIGFGQLALDRDDVREETLRRMEICLDAMLDPRTRLFETNAWGNDALDTLSAAPGSIADRGHVAYLGYAGLALALHRTLRPSSRFEETESAIAAALARRIEASPTGLLETSPGDISPVDNAAALATLGLHERATHGDRTPALERGLSAIRRLGIDPRTGLLYQSVGGDGAPRAAARASATALASYLLSFAEAPTSHALYAALEKKQFRTVLGFGGMREYPSGHERGAADVDSGLVFFGFGVSASAFALGASRVHGNRAAFTALYATAHLFGAPLDEDGVRTYVAGGALGDTILFAMLTARRAGRFGGT